MIVMMFSLSLLFSLSLSLTTVISSLFSSASSRQSWVVGLSIIDLILNRYIDPVYNLNISEG